jgi:putative flippase GtrA
MTSARRPDIDKKEWRKGERRAGGRRLGDFLPGDIPALTDIAGWFHYFRQLTYMRYLAVSVTALGIDLGLFLILLQTGMNSVAASAIGYSVGILVHWFLSSRKVFQDRVSDRGTAERTQQKAMFVMSALLGLVTTMAIMALGEWLVIDARISKLVAIAVSFQLTYVLRNILIFRSTRAA